VTCCRYCRTDRSGQLHLDEHWRLVHARPAGSGPFAGWLVLVPRRHVRAMHELTDEEAAGLARWLVPACRALHRVTGCDVEYVAQLADDADEPHVHLHLMARDAGAPRCRRGPGALRELRTPGPDRVTVDLLAAMAVALHPAAP
jgi:diadenosine tetraphosphate (Ap4A) HIT family hydrolase